MITPKTWKSKHRPVCLHYPGTGDHSYHRRRVFLANQLIDDGIASVIIMNPFYGARLPVDQKGSGLNYLSDLFVMGGALILECHTILRWCQNQGYGPFALHGVSMGGYMATICATTVPFPVSLIPCLSWTSASVVFIEGVLSHSVDWQTLTKQYLQDSVYSKVVRPKIQPSIQPAFVTKTQRPANSLLSATSETKGARSPATDLLVPPPPPPSPPPSGQKTPDYIFDVLTFYQRPLSDVSKVLDYVKSHNRLHLYFDNHIWDSAMSAVRAVPIPSVFPEKVKVDPEVREFLRELLDFFTHLGNFPPVADARLITSVTAGRDAYVPRDGVVPFDVVFPAADIRYLPQSGHVSTYVRNYLWNQDFRKAPPSSGRCPNLHLLDAGVPAYLLYQLNCSLSLSTSTKRPLHLVHSFSPSFLFSKLSFVVLNSTFIVALANITGDGPFCVIRLRHKYFANACLEFLYNQSSDSSLAVCLKKKCAR
ncbi:protein of unknown function DUF2048 [Echinococcus multilocularis]|uniref:Uncharacterized protein n=1 Tax=Echinococcus multilocularis TaxID=6211 RepID=A0A068Y9M7_ECHMU|nr:protein of unknown function DUF2048 [Echinococcus multilocularis]